MSVSEPAAGVPNPRRLLPKDVRRQGYKALARTVCLTTVLALVYAYAPMREPVHDGIPLLIGSLVLLVVLVAWHVRAVSHSHYPGIRAMEALTTTVPFLLLSFSAAYFMIDEDSVRAFGAPITRLDALYFTVTTFATVGFGDISARSELARSVVTAQMLVDLLFIGIVARVLVSAVRVGRGKDPVGD